MVQADLSLKPVSLEVALSDPEVRFSTGIEEVDRVLGGGLVGGSVTLLGGEPGIGKSTLVLQLCNAIATSGGTCLVATGEESVQQVAQRAERLGVTDSRVSLLATTQVEAVLGRLAEDHPRLLIVDSIQTMSLSSVSSAAGSVTQVRESASVLVTAAKQAGVALIMIGHVTKDGGLAGPRVLEHLVDTVVEFEGDRHHQLRFLRVVKHRFGATDELGVFEMTAEGLQAVPNASGLFLEDRAEATEGSVVVPILNGRRSMLVELQALVVESQVGRRVAQGMESGRLALVLAALQKHAGLNAGFCDVYATIVGGLRVVDPAVDLALALALASSMGSTKVPATTLAIGEVGLSGEIRRVPQLDKRLSEAARLGFTRAIVPKGATSDVLELVPVSHLREAVRVLGPPVRKRERKRE